jgi:hypothetical protein
VVIVISIYNPNFSVLIAINSGTAESQSSNARKFRGQKEGFMAAPSSAHSSFSARAGASVPAGILGGLAGGVIFGMMMQIMGMIPMIAMLVGSESVALGWIIHLGISAFVGATFALLLGRRANKPGVAAALGLGYGAVWWVLGPLLIMPAKLGMPTFMFNDMTTKSLVGHLIYGVVLGTTYALVKPRLDS